MVPAIGSRADAKIAAARRPRAAPPPAPIPHAFSSAGGTVKQDEACYAHVGPPGKLTGVRAAPMPSGLSAARARRLADARICR
jgi:hypothetical protein